MGAICREYRTPAYAVSMSIMTVAEKTLVAPANLSGPTKLNISVGEGANSAPYANDTLEFLFTSSVGARVTMGSGIAASAPTLDIGTGEYGWLSFIFNGSVWVETGRTVTI